MGGRARVAVAASAAIAAAALLAAPSASAVFPGSNGRIAFTHVPDTGDTDIFAIDDTGANPTPLATGPDNEVDPSYSADGERIAFARFPEGGPGLPSKIWVMNHDGSGQVQVTNGTVDSDRFPAFSPDGQRIAFERRIDGTGNQIWIMNADGSGQTQLTFDPPGSGLIEAFEPAFSPDGQTIAFRRDTSVGDREIWVMNADGSGQTRLTSGSFDAAPDFSPDGQRIVFGRLEGGESDLWSMNADGSGQAPLSDSAGQQDYDPVFSPDGARVAFSREAVGMPTFGNVFTAASSGLNQGIAPVTTNTTPNSFEVNASWQPLNAPACDLGGDAKSKSVKRVSVTVTCTNENATVVAEGSGKAPKPKTGLAIASKAKRFTIPEVTTEAPEGTPTTITLTIPRKGKKALKKAAKAGKKGKATITATLTDDLGESSQDSLAVKFKPRKKK